MSYLWGNARKKREINQQKRISVKMKANSVYFISVFTRSQACLHVAQCQHFAKRCEGGKNKQHYLYKRLMMLKATTCPIALFKVCKPTKPRSLGRDNRKNIPEEKLPPPHKKIWAEMKRERKKKVHFSINCEVSSMRNTFDGFTVLKKKKTRAIWY